MKNPAQDTDRYKTFNGIDCEGNARGLVTMLRRHIDDPEKSNAFWEKFKGALDPGTSESGSCLDNLFLIHSYINTIRELFEEYEDNEALRLLDKIEVECC
ncbi:N(2)-fixation sustaining protein CowN [Trichloromonas sp.]|uniref:N(2)-fixation sustaining protein CowN n=1 Tax=Trichloromonas sp. TaxID=3069249 RepID=UPI003D81A7B0